MYFLNMNENNKKNYFFVKRREYYIDRLKK